jgi:hypothetical protein
MATPNDAQLIKRRVFDDAGNLLREGMVSKDIPNERSALLAYWQEKDAAEAQAQAAAAEAEAAALAALEQQPANGEAMAIPALAAAIDQHATLIEALDQRTATIEAAQPDEILRLATQIQLGAGAAMALEAKALEVQAQIEATATSADQRLGELDQRMAESVAKVADLVTGGRQQLETTTATITADAKKQVAALITSTVARVQDLRGPRGQQGNPGASTVIGAGRPEGAAAMEPLIGRGAVIGDCYIDAQDARRRAYRWDGSTWEPGPEMVSLELRDVAVQALNTGNTVFSASGGSGSGGGMGIDEKLITNRIAPNASICVADCSNWANLPEVEQILSGVLDVSIRPLNGSLGGRSLRVDIPFTWETSALGGDRFTVDGDLGTLDTFVDLTVNVQRGAATAAFGYAGAMPNKTVTRVFLTVSPKVGGGGFGTTTMFRLAGDIAWDFEAAGVAITAGQPLPQPLWYWA